MITFFISSTFEDMGDERRRLHTDVLPAIHDYSLDRGVAVSMCDLRWGIRQTGVPSETLGVCLREIERCRPYFVAMIGDRYGEITKNNDAIIEECKKIDEKFKLDSSLCSPGKDISFTQWELEYAFLSRVDPDINALCFFRKSDAEAQGSEGESPSPTDQHRQSLNELKRRIEKAAKAGAKSPSSICRIEYGFSEEFAEEFVKRAKKIIDKESVIGSKNKDLDQELYYADAYSREKIRNFAGRTEQVENSRQFFEDETYHILEISGESGIGKTSFLCYLYHHEFASQYDRKLILCGNGSKGKAYVDVLKTLIHILEDAMGIDAENTTWNKVHVPEDAEQKLRDRLRDYCSLGCKPLLFFIDAMDKIAYEKNNIIDIFLDLEDSVSRPRLVCSQIDSSESANEHLMSIRLEHFVEEDVRDVLRAKLYSREQNIDDTEDDGVITAVLGKGSCASLPIYLDSVISILKMHMERMKGEDFHNIAECYASLIRGMPSSLEVMCRHTVCETISFLKESGTVEEEPLWLAVLLLAASRGGLGEEDLANILLPKDWTAIGFARFRQYLIGYFRTNSNGCWDFEHDVIRESIRQNDLGGVREMLYKYNIVKDSRASFDVKIQDGIFLSAQEENYGFLKALFDEIAMSTVPKRSKAASELLSVIRDLGTGWLKVMVSRHPTSVFRCIVSLLHEEHGADDFTRRIAALEIEKKLWEILGITDAQSISRVARSLKDKSPLTVNNEQLSWRFDNDNDHRLAELYFAELCAEYVSIHENMDDLHAAEDFVEHPMTYLCGALQNNQNHPSGASLDHAFELLNHLFYSNNRLLAGLKSKDKRGQLEKLSEMIVQFCKSKKQEQIGSKIKKSEENHYDSTFYKMVGNVGQYYSYRGEHEEALRYHFKSLIKKAKYLSIRIDPALGDELLQLCKLPDEAMVDKKTITKLDFLEHEKFWQRNKSEFDNRPLDEKDILRHCAQGYRTIGTDLYHLARAENDDKGLLKQIIRCGCTCQAIAVELFSSDALSGMEHAIATTEIKAIGMFCQKQDLSSRDHDLICKWAAHATGFFTKKGPASFNKQADELSEKLQTLQGCTKPDKHLGFDEYYNRYRGFHDELSQR